MKYKPTGSAGLAAAQKMAGEFADMAGSLSLALAIAIDVLLVALAERGAVKPERYFELLETLREGIATGNDTRLVALTGGHLARIESGYRELTTRQPGAPKAN